MTGSAAAVGVLGGTFDPVHLGHLALADEARRWLGLRRVLLVPTAVPPHKSLARLSSTAHREAMLRLALADRPGLELCTIESRADRVCYTIDTLRSLRRGPPPSRPVFLMGTDSLLQVHTWRDYRELLAEFDLAIVDRSGEKLAGAWRTLDGEIAERIVVLSRAGTEIGGGGGRIFHLPVAPIPISSSAIRRRAARGDDLSGLVPPAVAEYIGRAGLYH